MLSGVIRALALQGKAIYVNLTGHWFINLSSMYFFAFYLDMGLIGLWYSKLILEYYIFTAYLLLINSKDWSLIIRESKERQDRDKLILKNDSDKFIKI
jgi:Na+-driven multidrug efflux pump